MIKAMKNTNREKLRQKLRAKIGESRISRSSKQSKEKVLDKELKKMGLDKEKLKADISAVKKQGGLTLNFSNK
mgnify:FL=1|jgi:hypothetical protein